MCSFIRHSYQTNHPKLRDLKHDFIIVHKSMSQLSRSAVSWHIDQGLTKGWLVCHGLYLHIWLFGHYQLGQWSQLTDASSFKGLTWTCSHVDSCRVLKSSKRTQGPKMQVLLKSLLAWCLLASHWAKQLGKG